MLILCSGSGDVEFGTSDAGLGQHVDSGFDQRVTAVVVEQTAGNFFELLVADDFRVLRSDFVAHRIWYCLECFCCGCCYFRLIVS